MRIDPRIGFTVSLLIFGAGALWLLTQWLAFDAIRDPPWPILGFRSHVITFLALFAVIACTSAALLFYRYLSVKADLLAGRNVIARWTVNPACVEEFSRIAGARARAEKRRALYVMLLLSVLLFGAMALIHPEVALPILVAVALALLLLALEVGDRKTRFQTSSAKTVVGTEGVLVNDALHVWNTPLSWLVGAEIEKGPPPVLRITYAFCCYGFQFVRVVVPLGPDHLDLALAVVQRLQQGVDKPFESGEAAPVQSNGP
jgi:hypothetical protein